LLVLELSPQTVVIESNGAADSTEIVVASCNAALGPGRCRPDDAEDVDAEWYAVVHFLDAEHRRARVEFRQGSRGGEEVNRRSVEFDSQDTREQRDRAVGLIVAAHVLGVTDFDAEPEESPEVEPPTPLPAEPEHPVAPQAPFRSNFGFDLGAHAGPGLDQGAPRFGGTLRTWLRLSDFGLLGLVGFRAAVRADEPAIAWLSPSLGLIAQVAPQGSRVALEIRSEIAAERVLARARDDSTGLNDSGGVWRFGPRLGIDLSWPTDRPVSFLIGVEGAVMRPEYLVQVADQSAGREPAVRWIVAAGLRLSY
jgi:hypothetical protein